MPSSEAIEKANAFSFGESAGVKIETSPSFVKQNGVIFIFFGAKDNKIYAVVVLRKIKVKSECNCTK